MSANAQEHVATSLFTFKKSADEGHFSQLVFVLTQVIKVEIHIS